MSRSYIRLIVHPVRSIRTALKVFRPHVWVLSGDEISSGKKLSIIYAGNETNRNFISHLAFGDSCRDEYIGKKWLWKIPAILEQNSHNCSLAVVEVPDCLRILSERTKCFYVPGWVNGQTDISDDNSSLFKNRNSSLKSDLSKIRRNEFQFEVTTDTSELYKFYHNMYVPYITKVHRNRSKIMTYDFVKRQFRKGGLFNDLLLIKEQDEYVAGVLLHYKKDKAKLSTLGVKDGNLDYVKNGAIGALFCFTFQWAREKGFAAIDFGGSRPFLKDGILRYKRKWNQEISNKKEIGFFVGVLSETDGAKGFFLNNPFIYEDQTGLNGAIFVAGDRHLSADDFARIHKQCYHQGLSKLVIYQFDQTNGITCSHVPPEFSDCIAVCSAKSIFWPKMN